MTTPEIELIKMLGWRHSENTMSPQNKICENTQVVYIKYINPENKKIINTCLMCPTCFRTLEAINGKEN